MTNIDMMSKISENIFSRYEKINGGNIVSLIQNLEKIIIEYELFSRDIITGLVKSNLVEGENKTISILDAERQFNLFFHERLWIIKTLFNSDGSKRITYKKPTVHELEQIWKQVLDDCSYNSRKELFDNIPEWDKTKRIDSFMLQYFKCPTNPNFFRLFLTSIIGKMDDPEKNYCPYFFDFVSYEKGTGKTSLFPHLLGKYAIIQHMTSRREDFYASIYDSNAIIVNDDECTWISNKDNNKMSYDEFKAVVSNKYDRFSRKFQQPEERPRSFIIVRTSNEVQTVFSPNERRQIIFECHLKEQQCLHLDLPDSYMTQLLAEAKDFYLKNNRQIYALTEYDKSCIETQNMENFNFETVEIETVKRFFKDVRKSPESYTITLSGDCPKDYYWISWSCFNRWCEEFNKKSIPQRIFWRNVEALCRLEPQNYFFSRGKKWRTATSNSGVTAVGVAPVSTLPDGHQREVNLVKKINEEINQKALEEDFVF